MLGEAALTQADADAYFDSYAAAITHLGRQSNRPDPRDRPGISIKLSALHPRYEQLQAQRVMAELVPRVTELARMAAAANMGLNIDAEEAERLAISLDVIDAVLRDPQLRGWDGFGVVVQAYGKSAAPVIDWLHALAEALDCKIMVRLVKGAYWDTEIKHAQVLGQSDYPVFTTKPATDVSYICCAAQLLQHTPRLYPQFATHNAHTIAAILELAKPGQAFEFQRLHGMGESVHEIVKARHNTRCRIYAPVGVHRDLLAYLVRRLLENGANSSFVNQLVDPAITPQELVADPVDRLGSPTLPRPGALYHPGRRNSAGWHLQNPDGCARFLEARAPFVDTTWDAAPLIHGGADTAANAMATPVGTCRLATQEQAAQALSAARAWTASAATRASVLEAAADLYEANAGIFFAALTREAGKTAQDAVDELREAVDFLRFYANEGKRLAGRPARGIFTCISPWNFPLAIFTGQIAAALAAGNGVLAKPADPTPTIAFLATQLLHRAGVPSDVLQLLPGDGPEIGARLTSDKRVDGVCFTGSTRVAQIINRAMAANLAPDACLIAETGGLNAMVVDSTALPEQAIQDILDGAFRSAGQRCSALRVLYVQRDIAEPFLEMLFGAMDQLRLGDPWDLQTDVGPIITQAAQASIAAHIAQARRAGRLLKQLDAPSDGTFVGPAVIRVDGIADLAEEVFGPVLHVATFEADGLDQVVRDINASGYGLTFGLHTRINARVEEVSQRLHVGNIYVNRNQIGAVVESQPFGGEGLSGTGPKAGGPRYVARMKAQETRGSAAVEGPAVTAEAVQQALRAVAPGRASVLSPQLMPGPTGELNRLSTHPRGLVLCLGPTAEDAMAQRQIADSMGCAALAVAPGLTGPCTCDGVLAAQALTDLPDIGLVAFWGAAEQATAYRKALAAREGPIVPFTTAVEFQDACVVERHLCVDTTASGGNAELMSRAG